jgi:hypothetical protein
LDNTELHVSGRQLGQGSQTDLQVLLFAGRLGQHGGVGRQPVQGRTIVRSVIPEQPLDAGRCSVVRDRIAMRALLNILRSRLAGPRSLGRP